MYKIQGEKSNCRKVEILRKYPFPTYDDTKFVTENTIWEKIDREFDSCCVNNIFRVYYPDSPDSLAKGRVHSESRMNSRFHYAVFCINDLFDEILYNKNIFFSVINFGRSSIATKKSYRESIKQINKWYKRVFVTLIGYLLGFIFLLIKDRYYG